jgi:hypothetical protein
MNEKRYASCAEPITLLNIVLSIATTGTLSVTEHILYVSVVLFLFLNNNGTLYLSTP